MKQPPDSVWLCGTGRWDGELELDGEANGYPSYTKLDGSFKIRNRGSGWSSSGENSPSIYSGASPFHPPEDNWGTSGEADRNIRVLTSPCPPLPWWGIFLIVCGIILLLLLVFYVCNNKRK